MGEEAKASTARLPGEPTDQDGAADSVSSEFRPPRVVLVGVSGPAERELQGILADEGCEVLSHAGLPGLLASVGEDALDLVFIDTDAIAAPAGELTRDVKSVAPGTMVMVLSSGSDTAGLIEAVRAGAYDFFQKPASPDELRHRLHLALENKRLGQTIKRRSRQLTFVNEIANAVSTSLDLRQVLHTAATAVRALIGFDLAAALLRSASEPTLTVHPLVPDAEAALQGDRKVAIHGTVFDSILEDAQARLYADLEAEGPVPGLEALGQWRCRSLIVLPLVAKGRAIGILVLGNRQAHAFTPEHLQALGHVGGHLAAALENAQLYEQLKGLSSELEDTVEQRTREVFEVKRYLENLVETAGDAVVTTDLDGTITSWNKSAEEILGYAKTESRGRDILTLASGEGAKDQLATILANARAGRTTANAETAWLRKDRKEATVSLTVSPITDSAQLISGVLTIARDITDRKKLQEELFHSEKLTSIGQLAAGVAHQINSPLGAISGRTQMLLRLTGALEEEFLCEQLAKIQADCARITDTINDLLGFARKTETTKQYNDVGTIIDETLEMVKHEVIAHKVKVVRRFSDDLPPILSSANHLRQLFANLMTNAFDAIGNGGSLTITATFRPAAEDHAEQTVEVAFSDTGPGIPQEQLPSIFEPFYTTKPAGEGTGLGLAVAKRIVDFHNGHIDVESTVGQGTTFTIHFPAE